MASQSVLVEKPVGQQFLGGFGAGAGRDPVLESFEKQHGQAFMRFLEQLLELNERCQGGLEWAWEQAKRYAELKGNK